MEFKSLVAVIRQRSSSDQGVAFIDSSVSQQFLSYRDLYDQSLAVLFELQRRGLQRGDELLFQVSNEKQFITLFWACVLGGIIPVPLAIGRNNDHLFKVFNVWQVLNRPRLITSAAHLERLGAFSAAHGLAAVFSNIEPRVLRVEEIGNGAGGQGEVYPAEPDDLAYVQFSSGSTGTPKGVRLTHRNLLVNTLAILQGINHPPEGDLFFSWMPLTHDMGLIGYHLTPVVAGWLHYIMPTELFIRRPSLWLKTISRYRITFTASPNFGYRYLLDHLQEETLGNVDLSSVRIITNGAEPISADLCEEFTRKFAKYGLRDNVIFPVYGLAEASLAVTFSQPGRPVETLRVDRRQLNVNAPVRVVGPGEAGATFVGVGTPIRDCAVRVVDEAGRPQPDGVVGYVSIKGDNVTAGYYNNPEDTARVLRESWLNTGDLGFFHAGTLYITGRAKDVFFIHGQNYYSHDLERNLEEAEGALKGKIVVSGYCNDQTQQEELLIFVQDRGTPENFFPVALRIKKHVSHHFGFPVEKILPVREIPKTTSGKVQRYKLVASYRDGHFAPVEAALNALAARRHAENNDPVAPADETEATLLNIWRSVLPRPDFGVTHSLYEIGGNSLKGAEILARTVEAFSVEVPFQVLYDNPTVRALARVIDSLPKGPGPLRAIESAGAGSAYPLSSAQGRLYHLWEADRHSTAYNVPLACRVEGPLDAGRLADALDELVRRHETLRTSFATVAGKPVQTVHPGSTPVLPVVEIQEQELPARLRAEVKPFDLCGAPLFRFCLFRLPQGHVLFMDFHHILVDGISAARLVNELFGLYAGAPVPPPAVRFREYVQWEAGQAGRTQTPQQYWLQSLSGPLPVLNLPIDRPRPALFQSRGAKLEFALSEPLAARLREVAAEKRVTLSTLLLAAYYVLLAKYTNQEDIIVGVPVSGRPHSRFGSLVGMLVNNLAVRTQPTGRKPFSALLQEVRQAMLAGLDNQHYLFEHLVENLALPRDVSRNVLFDTMFVYQHEGLHAGPAPGITLKRYFFDPGVCKYDLTLEVFEESSGLGYYFEYCHDLFNRATIEQLGNHYWQLLGVLAANPEATLAEIAVLTPAEANAFTAPPVPVALPGATGTVSELFDRQAAATPDWVAVRCGDQALTYRDLARQVDRLAGWLQRRGVRPGEVVALRMPRSPRLIVSLLAVLKSGACFLAIDPGLPDARVDFLLNDSGARLVLTDGTAHIPGGAHREGVAVDQVLAAATGADPLPPPADPAGLAYVIYTSGTTGNPKGVMVEHRSLVNYVLWSIKTYVGPAPVCMPFYTSVAFDLTLTSLFTPLLSGNTLIVYDDEEAAAALEKVVTDPRINTIKLTPSHLRILRNNNLLGVNRGIRQFIVGGEQLDTQLARQVHDAFRGAVTLYNEYGPTEATVGCMIHRFNLQETQPAVPVGVPIDNLGVYLLDSYLKPVPAGVTGEMYIAGTGVARGYLHQPALTEARFLPNPFLPGTKLYKTGDLARRNAEGLIEYLGRRDQQVKIKGHRIEPGEIESELTRSGLVQAAVVLAKPGPHGDCVLWAYCQAGADVSPYALRQYLTGRIPHYMIPAHFIRLAELPVTAGGKVNYAALQALEATESPRDAGTPANALEQVFVDAWKEVLNLDAVGTTDNFFDAGGDSIKAVQMASRLLAQGVSVQARTILEYQTIEQICRQVKDNRTVRTYSQEMAAGERDPLPIERWFLRRNFPNPAHYNQSVLLQFRQRVNRKAVEEAFNRLVAAHDALRTNYNPARKTLFYNNCLTERRFLTEYFDIAHLSPECQLQELELIGTALKGSINLYNDFPLKAAVIKAGDETHYLLITAHHLTIDGVSWRILLEDFYRLYRACQHGESLKLPPKTASLKDWSQSLRALAAAPPLPDAHWEALERTPFAIPLDYEPDNWTVQHRESVSGSLSREATEFLLKQAPRTLGTGMLAPLLAALHDTLSRWMQAREVLVFVESHGRSLDDVDVSRTIGWFTSLCPLRIVDDPGPLPGLVRRIREQVDRIAGLSLSYGVSRYLNGEPGAGPAMHEVVFNYLGQFDHELNNDLFTFADHATGSDIDPANPMTAKLEFICRIIDQKLQLTVHYNALAHRRSTVQYLVSAYLTCLTDAIAQIDPGSNAVGTEPGMAEFELGEEDLKEIFG